jgi:Putative Ig domain
LTPHTQTVPQELENLSTRQLTRQAIEQARSGRAASIQPDPTATPLAAGTAVATYTPAQIRAAYGMPAIPAAGTVLSTTQAANLGAGQTIYIVDANDDPNAAAELAAFNQKFGLPTCTSKTIAASTPLPLAAASKTACEFAVVYATSSGTLGSTAPAYDSGWATEIAMDVQWAHATAPLARIVLIEAVDTTVNSLTAAIRLANAMGPGVVSMSFGSTEGNWTASVESTFAGANMSYVASTGDTGAAVAWPSVSPSVLAVGGTSLNYTGTGTRSEVTWSGTGGGVSAYTAAPAYQSASVPGLGSVKFRNVADVAFNADPSTGQYLATMSPGTTTVGWLSAGGTSLAAPQWAGIIAVANGLRALTGTAALGVSQTTLYGKVATSATAYAGAFADIVQGSNGSCATCTAAVGYDTATGLGTPNVTALLGSVASTAPTPPVVTAATIQGTSGVALSFTPTIAAANPVTLSLTGAPSGMSVSTTGVVSWPTPVAGSYTVTVAARDTKTGLVGQGTYTVTITAPQPPVVTPAAIAGNAGAPLSFTVGIKGTNTLSVTLTGAPSGMAISTAGVLTWPSPVQGSYKVTVTAKDTKTNLSGQGVLTITIGAAIPPSVSSGSISGNAGTALSFNVTVTAPNPVTVTLTGAPTGMSLSTAGVVSWTNPSAGTYSVTVTATDTKTGLSGKGVYQVTVNPPGPVITAAAMTGVAGKPLTGTIGFSDATSTSLSISISGVPMGVNFTLGTQSIGLSWPSPVTGSYTLQVNVTDGAGLTASKSVPITITAK